ncbi:ATP-binding protein [Paenibacillus sp. SGZ-1009]|uniref:ATP-binding protein n=1 Tax=Paenibacillus campi TaxID=3106031 RepID=UPI002AFEFDA5|nr:ATP-binding protein [Paenibacillus sp. SGZ-1009]
MNIDPKAPAIDWEYVVQNLKSSVTIADARKPDFPLVFVNKHFTDLTGYTREEAIGYNCRFLQGEDTLPETVQAFREALAKQQSVTIEVLNYRKDGSSFWNEVNLDPIFDQNGECHYFVGIQFDITKRKQAELQVLQAKDEAESANVAKGRFLANISHEIRTPLNGIIGMTELILLNEVEEDLRDNMKIVQNSAETLLTLINDILDFSKAEAGKMNLEHIEYNLHELMDMTIKAHRPLTLEKRIGLNLYIDHSVPQRVYGDPHRLKQVLNNLIGNAVKFTRHGSVDVSLTGFEDQGEELKLRFRIKDSGIGIAKQDQNKLFQSFSQVDDSQSREFGGTGLGLVISQQIVELMQGTITVESEQGLGSTFEFTIPVRYPILSNSRSDSSTIVKKLSETVARHPKVADGPDKESAPLRVLLADDDRISCLITSRMLNKLGYYVDTVDNGLEVIRLLEQDDCYDLVLMDIQMPVMDGLESTYAIRHSNNIKNKDIPIIAITANVFKDNHDQIVEAGMNGVLSKPVQMERLAELGQQLEKQKRL